MAAHPVACCDRLGLPFSRQISKGRKCFMADKQNEKFIDAGTAESELVEADEEVLQEFADAQRLASGGQILSRELREHHSRSPEDTAGDIDADWRRSDIGEETPGGSTPTPDQDVVEELGEAVGLRYE